MGTKTTSAIRFVALFAVCGLLLAVSGASAATDGPGRSWEMRRHTPPASAGKGGDAAFLKTLSDSAACQSSCCWAVCPQEGGGVTCTDSYCEAWCPDGSYAYAQCAAT